MFFPFVLSIVVGTAESLYNPDHHDDRRMPVLLGAQNVRDRSTNGVDEKTFGQVKEILELNLTTNEESKLITRWIEIERKNAAERLKEEQDRAAKQLKEMAGDIRELEKVKEEQEKLLKEVSIRGVIEDFEEIFGKKFKNQRRDVVWKNIFETFKNDSRIKTLKDNIIGRKEYPRNPAEFSEGVYIVYGVISKTIHRDIMAYLRGKKLTSNISLEKHLANVVRVLMDSYQVIRVDDANVDKVMTVYKEKI